MERELAVLEQELALERDLAPVEAVALSLEVNLSRLVEWLRGVAARGRV